MSAGSEAHHGRTLARAAAAVETSGGSYISDPQERLILQSENHQATAEPARGAGAAKVEVQLQLETSGPYQIELGVLERIRADTSGLDIGSGGPSEYEGQAELLAKLGAQLQVQPAGPYEVEARAPAAGVVEVALALEAGDSYTDERRSSDLGLAAVSLKVTQGAIPARLAGAAGAETAVEAGSYTNEPLKDRLWAAVPGGAVGGGDPEGNPSWYPGPAPPPSPGANPWEPPESGARVGVDIVVTAEPAGQQFLNHPTWRPPAPAYRRRAYALGPFWRR